MLGHHYPNISSMYRVIVHPANTTCSVYAETMSAQFVLSAMYESKMLTYFDLMLGDRLPRRLK